MSLSRRIFNVSKRSFVVETLGSRILHRFSSYVVRVICTTDLDFIFMLFSRSRSRNTRFDLVINVIPKPYLSMISRHSRINPSCSSQCIYGSHIDPVPIIHLLRFLRRASSSNAGAFCLTCISSKSCLI